MDRTRSDDELVGRKYSLDDLPLDCLQRIISYFHVRHWPRIELVNRRLRAAVLANWWTTKEAHLDKYCEKKVMSGQMTRKEALQIILPVVITRSPHVRSIDGFSMLKWPQYGKMMQLDSAIMLQVAEFSNLRSITFADCDIRIKDLAIFLAESKSRAVLEELNIYDMNADAVWTTDREDEEMMWNALIRQPRLRLKAFRLNWNRSFPSNFLALLDASRLQVFSTMRHHFQPAEMIQLLSRCVMLEELRLPFPVSVEKDSEWNTAISALPSQKLRRFGLLRWDVSDDGVAEMFTQLAKKYPKLELLDIPCFRSHSGDQMACGLVLEMIGKRFKWLEEVHLGIGIVPVESVTQFIREMGQLKRLSLTYQIPRLVDCDCTGMIAAMASNLTNLTQLHLDVRTIWPDDAAMLLQLEKLKELSIRFLDGSERRISICQSLSPILVSLCADGARIDDVLLKSAIVNRVTRIRRLSLKRATITDASLYIIAASCPLLEELDIAECKGITVSGLQHIIDKCKKLKRVKVYCKITADIGRLVKEAPMNIELWPEIKGSSSGCGSSSSSSSSSMSDCEEWWSWQEY